MTAFHFNNANFAGYVFSDFYARKEVADWLNRADWTVEASHSLD